MTYDKNNLSGEDLKFRELVEKYFKTYSPKIDLDKVVTSYSKRMCETNNIALELATYNYRYGYYMKGKLFTNYDTIWVIGDFSKFYIATDSVLRDIYKDRKDINQNEGKSVVRYFEKNNDYKIAIVDCDFLDKFYKVKRVNVFI